MPDQSQKNLIEQLINLLSDTVLNIGFINGEGLGAFLLAGIAIVFIKNSNLTHVSILALVKILQRRS